MSKKWFSNAKLGMFIHWGLYSSLGRGEWVMYRDRIPHDKYAKLADDFVPRDFNPDKWCETAKKSGMKYVVLTTCHHDGFALFDSAADGFNSVKTAAKRDFVAEFVAACQRHGLKVGLYYSLGDWRFGIMKESDSAEKAEKMRELTHAQVRELMTNYGKIDVLWYDGGWCYPSTLEDTSDTAREFWRADELNAMVKKLQPDILINDRSGKAEDFGTTEGHIKENGLIWEACLTMGADENSYWGYLKHCPNRKSSAQLIYLMANAFARGGNVLINVGPDADGNIPQWQLDRLNDIGEWVNANREAVYGTKKSTVTQDVNGHQGSSSGVCSEKEGTLYFYILNWPGRELVIPVMKCKVTKVELLTPNISLSHKRDSRERLIISGLPENPPHTYCSIIKLSLA